MKNPFGFIKDFSVKKREAMVSNLLKVETNEKMFNKFTTLQNEISVSYDTKVLAVTSIKEDRLSAAFGKGLADAYAKNNSSALIIDANLFEPCLGDILNKGSQTGKVQLSQKVDAIFMKKEIYPSSVYKSEAIHKLIEENKDRYDHIIILVPSIKDHKEVSLLGTILNSVILVTRRDVTKKKDIFEALSYLCKEKIPVSKTVILK